MTPMPHDSTLAPWEHLRERLDGYFAARARGLLASELALSSRDGEELGRLLIEDSEGARLEAGVLRATIEREAMPRYRMLAGGAEVLVETSGSADASEVTCADRLYEVRLGVLRNTAVARSPEGSEAVRVAGGLTNRSYEVAFDAGDEGSLPVAVFSLYRIVALRRRAFVTGARGREDPVS
jgi:hypothetical protein